MLYSGRVVGPWRPRSLSRKEVSLIDLFWGYDKRTLHLRPVVLQN